MAPESPRTAPVAIEEDGASVEPDRLFFIEMITKDVELIPAILDLWDNSIDAAMRFLRKGKRSADALKGFRVDIVIDGSGFEIFDNCGGITLDAAKKRAFRLGRGKDDVGVGGAVGSFGVGMKRSLFKIGRQFNIKSASIEGAFELSVDVDTWKNLQGPWRFPFSSSDSSYRGTAPTSTSTRIRVTSLHDAISDQFVAPGFRQRLETELRIRRPEAYELGIVTALNGKALAALPLVLASGPGIAPLVRVVEMAGDVSVTVKAGMVTSDASNPEDDGDGSKFVGRDDAGWYVLANGRVLLAAEKTRLTGWGDDVGRYHPQYRNFRGYVEIRAIDGRKIPWNTTKTSVDEDSPMWQTIYALMRVALTEVQALLNRVKTEVQNERETGVKGPVTAALEQSNLVTLDQISTRKESVLIYPKASSPARPSSKRITFSVEKARFDAVADNLGESSGPEVGRKVFSYYERMEL